MIYLQFNAKVRQNKLIWFDFRGTSAFVGGLGAFRAHSVQLVGTRFAFQLTFHVLERTRRAQLARSSRRVVPSSQTACDCVATPTNKAKPHRPALSGLYQCTKSCL